MGLLDIAVDLVEVLTRRQQYQGLGHRCWHMGVLRQLPDQDAHAGGSDLVSAKPFCSQVLSEHFESDRAGKVASTYVLVYSCSEYQHAASECFPAGVFC